MCVLNDRLIRNWAEFGGLTPYAPECVNPASVDLRWSGKYKKATPEGWGPTIDCDELVIEPIKKYRARQVIGIDYKTGGREVEWFMEPIGSVFYLLDTIETIKLPDDLCARLYLKSSRARDGFEHSHAAFFDPGFYGTATLEITSEAPWPIRITRGQRIVQLVIEQMAEKPMRSYQQTGRYNGQTGPTPARGL